MRSALSLAALVALVAPSMAAYVLKDDYAADNFFDMFEFFTAADPTHGFVSYVDQATAQADGLISTNGNGQVTLGVDSKNVAPNGRNSVRLTSNAVYNHGLIILDLAHMPVGCGTWPAFWTVGPNWPSEGEVDIIEGVNEQLTNAMTLHTGSGCGITTNNLFSGAISTANCYVDAVGQPGNAGCSIDAKNQNTYGAGLNSAGGGVYATEWTSEAISIYFFPADSIPSDISSGAPNPSGWGQPVAMFQGACELDSFIQNQQIVFDMTFCGDWAGAVWSSSSCAAQSGSCTDFVANNPSAFADAYWEINSLKVYEDNGEAYQPASSTSAGPTGVASNVPSDVSSLAPIPVSSASPLTTLVTSTTQLSVSISQINPNGALLPASSTPSVYVSPTSTYVPPSSTSQYVAPTSTYVAPPSSSQYVAPTTSVYVPPTSSAPPATTAAPTETPEAYFSYNAPVPASWFEPGGGIPTNQEFGTFKNKRGPATALAYSWEEVFHGEKDNHGRHVVFHGKMGAKKHRHFLP